MGRGNFRKYVDPAKIRWYDYIVLLCFYLIVLGIESWAIRIGKLGHIAYMLGSGWYAVDVIDGRPMPKEAARTQTGQHE
jgi:hypothetical protein